ncbi:unnamed protein product [Thlaspi arvense]|uniref:Uncharacterized protein n=1 Tax=Thlaspi arvense TaxID=13288 RepID=A0AAU9RTG7_THLAR|nr:unnamed protein product [Thlaspi arvense]
MGYGYDIGNYKKKYTMDLDKGGRAVDDSTEVSITRDNSDEGAIDGSEGGETLEPYVGMEFDCEDAATKFYIDYARQIGFVVRMMGRRRSEIDGRTLAPKCLMHSFLMAVYFMFLGDKDKKIEELTREVQLQDQLCASYREKLLTFLSNVEEQAEYLSAKVQVIVDNVRKAEAEVQKQSRHM